MCSFWNGTHNCLTLAPRSAGAVPYTLLFYQPSRLPPLSTGMAQMPYVGTTSSRWCFLNALLLLHQPSHLLRLSTGMAWLPYAGSMSTSPLTSLVCQQVWHGCLMLATCPAGAICGAAHQQPGTLLLFHQLPHLPRLSTGEVSDTSISGQFTELNHKWWVKWKCFDCPAEDDSECKHFSFVSYWYHFYRGYDFVQLPMVLCQRSKNFEPCLPGQHTC